MPRFFFWALALLSALPAFAVEQAFNFSEYPLDQTPPGFRSTVAGAGKPGDWKVILDESPAPESLASNAPASKRVVLAQLARQPLDMHFPMLIFEGGTYGDFRLTTRFKIVGGALEQMAGVVFHFQNESNFYVALANVLGGNFRCYKVENGVLKPPIGPELKISKDVWHELTVQCEGPRILCALDGNEAIKLIDDTNSPSPGKIGFWTKSDSVSYFVDTKITYARREVLAQALVRQNVQEFPRLLGLKIFAVRAAGQPASVVASKDESDVGQPGGKTEEDVIHQGLSYYGKDKGSVTITAPLRDRNGDSIAAVQVVMKSFPGQTQDNAVARALPIVKRMQSQVQSLEELLR